jgi:hypothetical protein
MILRLYKIIILKKGATTTCVQFPTKQYKVFLVILLLFCTVYMYMKKYCKLYFKQLVHTNILNDSDSKHFIFKVEAI